MFNTGEHGDSRRLVDLVYSGEGLGVAHTRVREKTDTVEKKFEVKEEKYNMEEEAEEELALSWACLPSLPPDQRAWWGRLGVTILTTHSPSIKVLS